ncbi:MAG: hypothetical protein LUI10_07125 [Lachnospiraceae bacterium]|nr:hypothetical protein [Lachnospiraceae bacterium]
MSVKSMLDSDERFREIIKEHLPKREQFRTNKGDKAFSTKYKLLAPNTLPGRYYSTLAGTAFDYAARFITARYASGNCGEENEITSNATSDLNSFYGLVAVRKLIGGEAYKKMHDRYIEHLSRVKAYLKQPEADHSILSEPCSYFARLEHIYRSGGILPRDGYEVLLKNEPQEVYDDLKRLCDVFFETFITSGIVHDGSKVVFNPTFGKVSTLIDGADADIYMGGVLYDFKAAKESRYRWQEVAQIYVYYLLDCLEKISVGNDSQTAVAGKIHSIAPYKARFRMVESFDVMQIDREDLIDTLVKLKDYLCTVEMRMKRPGRPESMDTQTDTIAAEITADVAEIRHSYMQAGMMAEVNDVKIRSWADTLYST